MIPALQQKIQQGDFDFESLCAELWQYQYAHNPVLQQYCNALNTQNPNFLPIQFFKHFDLKTGDWQEVQVFESSRTTGQQPSRHLLKDAEWYKWLSVEGFFLRYPRQKYKILALLPSYLERGNSSLVQMVQHWIEAFGLPGSGFYLDDFQALSQNINAESDAPLLLIGVSFALLDFANTLAKPLPAQTIVIETGGMKGRGEELTRKELHHRLSSKMGVSQIGSEYGMTELLSQAYATASGRFMPPPWLKIQITDIHLSSIVQPIGVAGRINVIDLGNTDTCAFIATDDLGRMHSDGSFEVLGRIDFSELRGCNLLYLG